jgi:cytochrome c biogenesis protein CcmG, thiol:disulfide interchange protein DsbE
MAKKPSNIPYLITAILALGVIVTAWTGRDRFQTPGPGGPAPHFEVVTLDGEPVTLQDFGDQVVLLNVWATWCAPCRYEMPSMQRLYEEFEGEDFEIVAVSVDGRQRGSAGPMGQPAGNPRAFADSLSLTFPILWDPDGRIMRTYRTTGIPESFLIGRDGLIYRKVAGATEWDRPEYVEFIRRLLNEEA